MIFRSLLIQCYAVWLERLKILSQKKFIQVFQSCSFQDWQHVLEMFCTCVSSNRVHSVEYVEFGLLKTQFS